MPGPLPGQCQDSSSDDPSERSGGTADPRKSESSASDDDLLAGLPPAVLKAAPPQRRKKPPGKVKSTARTSGHAAGLTSPPAAGTGDVRHRGLTPVSAAPSTAARYRRKLARQQPSILPQPAEKPEGRVKRARVTDDAAPAGLPERDKSRRRKAGFGAAGDRKRSRGAAARAGPLRPT